MKTNLRFAIGGLVISATVGYLILLGISRTSSYYLTIGEFLPQREALAGEGVRVAGRVRPGSIDYDPKTLRLSFEMGELGEAVASESLPVAFTGIKPDMFADGRDVIVEGHYREGTLHADQVLTSCPSKYEADIEADRGAAPGYERGARG